MNGPRLPIQANNWLRMSRGMVRTTLKSVTPARISIDDIVLGQYNTCAITGWFWRLLSSASKGA
jgi:hypothetical protein